MSACYKSLGNLLFGFFNDGEASHLKFVLGEERSHHVCDLLLTVEVEEISLDLGKVIEEGLVVSLYLDVMSF